MSIFMDIFIAGAIRNVPFYLYMNIESVCRMCDASTKNRYIFLGFSSFSSFRIRSRILKRLRFLCTLFFLLELRSYNSSTAICVFWSKSKKVFSLTLFDGIKLQTKKRIETESIMNWIMVTINISINIFNQYFPLRQKNHFVNLFWAGYVRFESNRLFLLRNRIGEVEM